MSSSKPTPAETLPQVPRRLIFNLPIRTRPLIPLQALPLLPVQPQSPTPSSPQNDRPRRDSDTLPSNSHQLKNLAITHYCHIKVHDARDSSPGLVQYWISADTVLSDHLKETKVPAGHWPKLVALAKDVCGDRGVNSRNEVRMLTAFYFPNEEMKVDVKVESLPLESLPSELQ
ncbi:hypothetical protein GGI42DRAFT_62633 [Trichoderma sp. SZMC 28013]